MPKRATASEVARARRLAASGSLTLREIAQQVGLAESTLRRHGVKAPKRSRGRSGSAVPDPQPGLSLAAAAGTDSLTRALTASQRLSGLFAEAGRRLYLVGGAVREALSGRPLSDTDLDFSTDATPAQTRRIVEAAADSVWTQGERYGTVGCTIGEHAFEVTTHRADCYSDGSRKPEVVFGSDILDDLERRDFTINAMAVDTRDGTLLDPHNGRGDLAAGVLRTPLDPEISFGEDPLRMLRAARFVASHNLRPAAGLEQAALSMRHRLSIVSTERIRGEVEKLLTVPDPTEGLRMLFRTQLAEHALPAQPKNPERTARIVAAAPNTPTARWAALFMDTPGEVADHLKALRCSTTQISSVTALLAARRQLEPAPNDAAGVRRFVHRHRANVDEAVELARAAAPLDESTDRLDRFCMILDELRRTEDVDNLHFPLSGHEVMAALGIGPGPAVGEALASLREMVLDRGPLDRSEAIEALHSRHSGRCDAAA